MSFRAKDSEHVEDESGLQYHLKVKPNDLARTVLFPGDPKRIDRIVKMWDNFKEIADYRQYKSVTGEYKGVPISATSSGIGPAACEIALTELKNVGVENVIRVGSCGTLVEDIEIGSVIISEGAVRLEDTSDHYVDKAFPALASRKITSALIKAAVEHDVPYHVGITATASSFYAGQGRHTWNNYLPSHRKHLIEDLTMAGVLNLEMEASLIFVLGKIFKMEVGAVSAVYANRPKNQFAVKGEENAILVANEATNILISEYEPQNKKYWY